MRNSYANGTGLSFLLILIVLVVLGVFSETFGRTRAQMEAEGHMALEFRGAWFELKSDVADLSLGLGGARAEASAELALVSDEFQKIHASPVMQALGAMDGKGNEALPDLELEWQGLWARVQAALDPDEAVARDSYQALSLESRRFEADMGYRLALIDSSAAAVRASINQVNRFIVLAMFALLGLGMWSAQTALKERADRRRLRELMNATLEAQEAERKRLALELHDTVAQELAAASMYVSRLPNDPEGHRLAITQRVQGAIRQLRDLSWQMRPPALERYGFLEAAAQLCRDFSESQNLEVEFLPPPAGISRLGSPEALSLYRILQEALANIAHHAKAGHVRVEIEVVAKVLRMRIEDDGQGFEPEAPLAGPGHQGIPGMEERARMLGGRLSVTSHPGSKTYVSLEIPYA
jgi:signal transduction histidine kinase